MDKRKSILNVIVSIGFKLITMIMAILVKRLLIQYCGNEVNGLNSLYLGIIGFLAVAELGVGSAITFCMYKPIVEGNQAQVAALYRLFQRLYTAIGSVILIAGLAIMPFIHYFARDYAQLNVNFQKTFLLMLLSVVLTYGYSAKTSLINAYKNNYITTTIVSGGLVLQYLLQIAVLMLTHSFAWYLGCRIIASLAQWVVTEIITRKKYGNILSDRQKLDRETAGVVKKNVRAMFMHKIGTLLVNTVDSIVISGFIGVAMLGYYSNYALILSSMTGLIGLIFTSLTSIMGHLYVKEDIQTSRKYCEGFHFLNFLIGTVFYLGYYAVIDDLIVIFFGDHLTVSKTISIVITLNGFIQFMRASVSVFRDATGTFYNDRWKPFVEGVTNLILSVFLVKQIGVTGVILATAVTNLLICHVVEPYVLYKNAFGMSPKEYYVKNYGMIILFFTALLLLHECLQTIENRWMEMLVNGCISIGISALISTLVLWKDRTFRHFMSDAIIRRGKR